MLPVRWEGLPGKGTGFAELHIHTFGALGTAVAVIILWDFLLSLNYRHTANARRNDDTWKFPYQFFSAASKNISFGVRQISVPESSGTPLCAASKPVKYLVQFQGDAVSNWKAGLQLFWCRSGLRHHCKDTDTHFQALRTWTGLHSPALPHLASLLRYIHSIWAEGPSFCLSCDTEIPKSCLSLADPDSLPGLSGLISAVTHHLAFIWLCKSDREWKVL